MKLSLIAKRTKALALWTPALRMAKARCDELGDLKLAGGELLEARPCVQGAVRRLARFAA